MAKSQTFFLWVIGALFFFTPLLVLPWIGSSIETSKQVLLIVSVAILGIVTALHWINVKQIHWRADWITILLGIFWLAVLASAFLTGSGFRGWVGYGAQAYESVTTITGLLLLIVFMRSFHYQKALMKTVFLSLLSSATLVGVFSILAMSGIMPVTWFSTAGLNPIGSVIHLSVFLSVVLWMGLAFWAHAPADALPAWLRPVACGLTAILALATLTVLMSIDVWTLWILQLIGFGLVVVGFFSGQLLRRSSLVVGGLVGLLAFLFLFLPAPNLVEMPAVVTPTYQMSWQVTQQSVFGSSIKNMIVGSGPGTFLYEYHQYKPESVNATLFWNATFDRARSHVLTLFTTLGVVGFVAWLGVLLMALLQPVRKAVRDHFRDEPWLTVVWTAWGVSLAGLIMLSASMTIQFLFWGLLALAAPKVYGWTWRWQHERLVHLSAAVLMLLMVGAGTLYAKHVVAEVSFTSAQDQSEDGPEIKERLRAMQLATELSPSNAEYWRYRTQMMTDLTNQIIRQDVSEEEQEEQQKTMQQTMTAAVASIERAVQAEPRYAKNWMRAGALYRSLIGRVEGAGQVSLNAHMQAQAREPINPVHPTATAQTLMTMVNVIDSNRQVREAQGKEVDAEARAEEDKQIEEWLGQAEQQLQKAIDLKRDYLPAHFHLATVFERQGRTEEAVERLGAIVQQRPNDAGLLLQYALVLTRAGEYQEAITHLERLNEAQPEVPNVLWALSSAYEQEGMVVEAISVLNQLRDLVPDAEVVTQKLDALERGQAEPDEEPLKPLEGEEEPTPEIVAEDGE